jgi:hypothetical protein
MDTNLQKIGRDLESPADLTDFPAFPQNTRSLLSTCLTREIWDKLRGKKINGFSFEEAIFSGCKLPESSAGVYAGCHESYAAFAPLFDPIIEKYHGHGANDLHCADLDFSKLDSPNQPADEKAMIVSMRAFICSLYPFKLNNETTHFEKKLKNSLSKYELTSFYCRRKIHRKWSIR